MLKGIPYSEEEARQTQSREKKSYMSINGKSRKNGQISRHI
jgi:hypothetical protein